MYVRMLVKFENLKDGQIVNMADDAGVAFVRRGLARRLSVAEFEALAADTKPDFPPPQFPPPNKAMKPSAVKRKGAEHGR